MLYLRAPFATCLIDILFLPFFWDDGTFNILSVES